MGFLIKVASLSAIFLLQIQIQQILSFPSNLDRFRDLHETDTTYDLNEEESRFHSTIIPPPKDLLFLQEDQEEEDDEIPDEARTEETTIIKPENQTTEAYEIETTTEPLVIIHQRYEIQVQDPARKTKRNDNDGRGGKLHHPEVDEEESTPAYGVLENASVPEKDQNRTNNPSIQNCVHDPMETERPILKHSELEDGVLRAVKLEGDFEESDLQLKDLTEEFSGSTSHESNTVSPTAEAYTAQETQIVIEDKLKPEKENGDKSEGTSGVRDEMKAGNQTNLEFKMGAEDKMTEEYKMADENKMAPEHNKMAAGDKMVADDKMTEITQNNPGTPENTNGTEITKDSIIKSEALTDTPAPPSVEQNDDAEAADVSATEAPAQISSAEKEHREFEDEPVSVGGDSDEIEKHDLATDTEVVTIDGNRKPKSKTPTKSSRTDWKKFIEGLLPKSALDVESLFLTLIKFL